MAGVRMRPFLLVLLGLVRLFAQDAHTTGTVEANRAEFKIPLEQPASATWNWNRAETPDNGGEYIWQVNVPNAGGRYSFGFFLYKFPGSKPARGPLEVLFKAGQASVFQENAEGRGDLVHNANVNVSAEDGRIVLRIMDAELIRTIFGNRPETVTINTRAIGANFEVVKVQYLK
jgi:hypothetical protein